MNTKTTKFQKHIEEELEDEVELSIEQQWQNIKATLKGAVDSVLGFKKQENQNPGSQIKCCPK